MQPHLTDLDALALTVREPRSRDYILEAIQAYRAGAYRAAIVATWVAVSFDLIMKLREIASDGDAAAAAEIASFDTQVRAGNQEALQRFERDLLELAQNRFGLLNAQDALHLTRLKIDRNHCAHPSFYGDDELFAPAGELVRLHLVNAMSIVLTRAPVQGQALINRFMADLLSPSFPSEGEKLAHYMTERYLNRVRPESIRNFGLVLVKAVLKPPAGHEANERLLLAATREFARTRPEAWERDVVPAVPRLIEGLSDDQRPNTFRLLRGFPALFPRLHEPDRTRLERLVDRLVERVRAAPVPLPGLRSFTPTAAEIALFGGIDLPAFTPSLLTAFSLLPRTAAAEVVASFPSRQYLDHGLSALRTAGSFRGAEMVYRDYIAPLAEVMLVADVSRLVGALMANAQAWDASDIRGVYLPATARALVARAQAGSDAWARLRDFTVAQEVNGQYDDLWSVLDAAGILARPTPAGAAE